MKIGLISFLLVFLSCSRWEYEDLSIESLESFPETYLSLISVDTIFARTDSIGNVIYSFDETHDSLHVWDTIGNAFNTISTSRQKLSWWGEDVDGNVVGYYYKWSSDSIWTYTNYESGTFFVPIRSSLDLFFFEVKAVDDQGNIDSTASKLILPIKNSAPEIQFRYRSNPLIANLNSDTSYTFPTRTFIWDSYDQDGNETITDVFYALNDTCDTCWIRLDGNAMSITLKELDIGLNTFFLKCKDIAGASSLTTKFPDSSRPSEAQHWIVKPIMGEILIVDDYPLDNSNNVLSWYSSMMDTLYGDQSYSYWEIGDELPYSATDVSANLNYFKNVFWFAAYNNTASASDTYNGAEASLVNFIMEGGNLFMNPIDFEDTTFTWFPLDSLITLNPNGRLFPGRVIESPIDSTLNLEVSHLIAVKVKGFWPKDDNFEITRELYRMADPLSGDGWVGNPIVCSIGQYRISPLELSGKIVLMTLPLHDGYRAKLQGNGSSIKLFQYLLEEEFNN